MSDPTKQLDLETLVRKVMTGIQSEIDFAYPGGEMADHRAHPALMAIQGRVRGLVSVLDCIEETSDGSNPS